MARRPTRRNPAARSPLLRKGGVHLESKSSRRHLLETQLGDALDEWCLELEEDEAEEAVASDDRDG